MIIKGKGFVLRPFRIGDEKNLVENINDIDVYRNTCRIPKKYTLKLATDWIAYSKTSLKKNNELIFAIDIESRVVGSIGFQNILSHKAEIGYWIGRKYRNKGIISQAIKLATNFGFNKMKLRRISAPVFYFNKKSAHVLKKNGYKLEGTMKNFHVKDKKPINALLFAKTK
jgi:[ribosomal protein S5]-alanine N-acetyltransferase